jgi:hypothetical protein
MKANEQSPQKRRAVVALSWIKVSRQHCHTYNPDLLHCGIEHDKNLLSLMIKSNMSTIIPPEQRLSMEQMLQQIPTFLIAGMLVSLLNRILH